MTNEPINATRPSVETFEGLIADAGSIAIAYTDGDKLLFDNGAGDGFWSCTVVDGLAKDADIGLAGWTFEGFFAVPEDGYAALLGYDCAELPDDPNDPEVFHRFKRGGFNVYSRRGDTLIEWAAEVIVLPEPADDSDVDSRVEATLDGLATPAEVA